MTLLYFSEEKVYLSGLDRLIAPREGEVMDPVRYSTQYTTGQYDTVQYRIVRTEKKGNGLASYG